MADLGGPLERGLDVDLDPDRAERRDIDLAVVMKTHFPAERVELPIGKPSGRRAVVRDAAIPEEHALRDRRTRPITMTANPEAERKRSGDAEDEENMGGTHGRPEG